MMQKLNNYSNLKKLFIVFLLLIFKIGVYSQTILFDPAEVYVGATFGINASKVAFYPKVNQNPLYGYEGGLAFRYVTEKHVGLQIELNYSQRGWSESSGLYTRQLNYAEMPILTHLYWGKTHRLFFNLGPKISYLMSNKVLVNNATESTSEQHIKPVYFPFDYGIALGTGYNLHTKKIGVFQLEVRAYYGLNNIFADSKADYFSKSNYWNAFVKLGWFMQLTGKK